MSNAASHGHQALRADIAREIARGRGRNTRLSHAQCKKLIAKHGARAFAEVAFPRR